MSNRLVLGLVGFIGSGKDTAAQYLCDHYGFQKNSFAGSLKDCISAVLGWDRSMLEGDSVESREWRNTVDPWWAARLGIPNFTPRWVMQHWGTDLFRNKFHNEIWIASVEKQILSQSNNIVITDARFANEIESVRRLGGKIIRIKRGPDPDWFNDAKTVNAGSINIEWTVSKIRLHNFGVHSSETDWIGTPIDLEIENNFEVEQLYQQLDTVIKNLELGLPVSNESLLCEEYAGSLHR